MPAPPARAIVFADGELTEVGPDGRGKSNVYDPAARAQWHGMFTHIAAGRGYHRGWVAHKYKEKFGQWPAWGAVAQPIPPTPEVRSWVRSRMIAYAKARRSA
jgi:DNA repair protein RadD